MKKTIIALSIIPALAFAITAEQKEAAMQANMKVLQEQGLPTPGSGVQLVPKDKMAMPKWKKQKELAQSKELKAKGYVNTASDRALELMNIDKQIKKQAKMEAKMFKSSESHMRQKASDIQFAYTYYGVPSGEKLHYFGIAPVGTFVKEAGWTGAVEFFESYFAHCAYTENNLIAAHGAAQIDEEEATQDVNGKITLIDVEGNDSTGYLYRVNWFDTVFNHNLECATKTFSQATRDSTIELAKRIDRSMG